MPDSVGGIPAPNYGRGVTFSDQTLTSVAIPAINTDYEIPVLTRRSVGPSGSGYLQVQLSQNASNCAKNITVKVWANGVLWASVTQSMGTDSSAGTDRTYTFSLPANASTVNWRVTVATPCPAGGNGTIFLGSKALVVLPT